MAQISELPLWLRAFLRTYRWRRIDPVPLARRTKPVQECRVALVTTAARRCRRIILQNFGGTLAVDGLGNGLAAFGPSAAASARRSSRSCCSAAPGSHGQRAPATDQDSRTFAHNLGAGSLHCGLLPKVLPY